MPKPSFHALGGGHGNDHGSDLYFGGSPYRRHRAARVPRLGHGRVQLRHLPEHDGRFRNGFLVTMGLTLLLTAMAHLLMKGFSPSRQSPT
jgi:hypothetical protein